MAKKDAPSTGEKLRYVRHNCGLSQRQVANAMGLNRTTIGSWESGRTEPSLDKIVKLAQIYRVDPTEILPNESSPAPFKDPDKDDSKAKPIYSLTKEEQQLLVAFRLLSDTERAEVLAKITNNAYKD